MDINNKIIQEFLNMKIDLTQLEVCKWKTYNKENGDTYFNIGNLKIKQYEVDNESPIKTYVYYVLVNDIWEQFGYTEDDGEIILEYWS